MYLLAAPSPPPIDAKSGSIFDSLLSVGCAGSPVAGNYEGVNKAKYENGAQGEQKIAISVQQNGSDLKLRFQSPNGARARQVRQRMLTLR